MSCPCFHGSVRPVDLCRLLQRAMESLAHISTWADGAREYDVENGNPPREFCDDIALIEDQARRTLAALQNDAIALRRTSGKDTESWG